MEMYERVQADKDIKISDGTVLPKILFVLNVPLKEQTAGRIVNNLPKNTGIMNCLLSLPPALPPFKMK